MLPIQVNKEVDVDNHQFFHSQTHIIHDEMHVNDLKKYDNIHAVDNYATLFYVKDNEIGNKFFKYTPTQHDIDNQFNIPNPKRSH